MHDVSMSNILFCIILIFVQLLAEVNLIETETNWHILCIIVSFRLLVKYFFFLLVFLNNYNKFNLFIIMVKIIKSIICWFVSCNLVKTR